MEVKSVQYMSPYIKYLPAEHVRPQSDHHDTWQYCMTRLTLTFSIYLGLN